MNHATRNSHKVLLLIVGVATAAAGLLVRHRGNDPKPNSPATVASFEDVVGDSSQAPVPKDESANAANFFDPPVARKFPDQVGWPQSGGGSLLSPDTFEGDLDALPRKLPPRWQQRLSKGLAIAGFVLKGPPPTKPLNCLWYYYRVIPVWPYFNGNHDVRARQLIFHSEDLRRTPTIWERAWALDMPDVATPYRTHGGVLGDDDDIKATRPLVQNCLTTKQAAALRKSFVGDLYEASLVFASIAVKLPRPFQPASPLYWLQVWHRPPCGLVIPRWAPLSESRPRQLIFNKDRDKDLTDEERKRLEETLERFLHGDVKDGVIR